MFDAGARKAEVDRTRAVAEENLADYALTVAEAIREVEDNLINEKLQQKYITLLHDQLEASRLSMKDAQLQYVNGQSDYLSYLTALSSVQSLERQLIEEQATQIKYRVALYRALGGSCVDFRGMPDTADQHVMHSENVSDKKELARIEKGAV